MKPIDSPMQSQKGRPNCWSQWGQSLRSKNTSQLTSAVEVSRYGPNLQDNDFEILQRAAGKHAMAPRRKCLPIELLSRNGFVAKVVVKGGARAPHALLQSTERYFYSNPVIICSDVKCQHRRAGHSFLSLSLSRISWKWVPQLFRHSPGIPDAL